MEPTASVFGFEVAGPTFEIRLDGSPLVGRLVITVDDVPRGSASVAAGSGTEEIVVRAGAARVDVRSGPNPEGPEDLVVGAWRSIACLLSHSAEKS